MTPLPHSVSCWNLAGLSERVAKETVNEINLQFHVRKVEGDFEKQDRRQGVYIFKSVLVFFFFFLSCVHVRMQDDDCGKLFKRGKFKKWVARPASACHGTEEPNTKLWRTSLLSLPAHQIQQCGHWPCAFFEVRHSGDPSGITSCGTISCSYMNSEKTVNSVAVVVVWWVIK